MQPASSDGAMRVQAILGDGFRVLEFEQSTHSSAEAAAAIGCDVAQIAKSMMFRAADGQPVLVVASGANRVDERKVAALLGQKIKRADPAFVLAEHRCRRWAGVPPVGAHGRAGDVSGSGPAGEYRDDLGRGRIAERRVRPDARRSGSADGGGVRRCREINRVDGELSPAPELDPRYAKLTVQRRPAATDT